MPALNFKAPFADDVETRTKRQTFRAPRKVPIRAGDTLHLFTGMRTKECRRLGLAVKCCVVQEAVLSRFWGIDGDPVGLTLDGVSMSSSKVAAIAQADGFESVQAFADFFTTPKEPVWRGSFICW